MTRFVIFFCASFTVVLSAGPVRCQQSPIDAFIEERFSFFDRNQDGSLTLDEVDSEVPFDQLDTDQDGRVTRAEAKTYVQKLSHDPGWQAIVETWKELRSHSTTDISPRKPIHERIADRTFPSVFMAWSPATNLGSEDRLLTMTRHDLAFVGGSSMGLQWNRHPSGLADGFSEASIPVARAARAKLQSLNPNFILLAEIRYRDAHPQYLPEDHAWWKRDAQGKRMAGWEEGNFLLLDMSHPGFRAHVAQQARSAVETGAFDGVMLDWWIDDDDRLALIKEVRQAVGDEAIILVNANDRQTPRTAPFINGYFMECWRSETREDWIRIADTLRFAEQNLREPRLNCLETWYAESRQDLHRMRATTCLSLTHSNGYCLFSDPNDLSTADHLHDWYPFWEKCLGRPAGEGIMMPDGAARREFEKGTAVYNPPGNSNLTIRFEESRRSLATGKIAREHTVRALDGDIFLNEPMIRQGLIGVRLLERGAHLIEDFATDNVNTKRWRIWHSNPDRVRLTVEDGRFVIRGRDRIGHNGLWQLKARRFKDVSLVARFDIQSTTPRTHDLCLHLCGGDMPQSPDHWAEIAMEDLGDGKALFLPMLAVEQGAFQQSQKSLQLVRDGQTGFLGRVSLDGSTNLCSMEIRDAKGHWHSLIDPTPLRLRTTHCEVKMRGEGIDASDAAFESEAWFDDVRIYPRPAAHPILVRLVDPKGHNVYRRLGETWPPQVQVEGFDRSPLADLVVQLWTADGEHCVASVQSNNFAYYMLPVVHEAWDVFPVAAKIRLLYKDKPLGEIEIPSNGLEGVYPDDVYELTIQ